MEHRDQAQRVPALVRSFRTPTWRRDDLHAGEMWNWDSLTSWLLVRSGFVHTDAVELPRAVAHLDGQQGAPWRDVTTTAARRRPLLAPACAGRDGNLAGLTAYEFGTFAPAPGGATRNNIVIHTPLHPREIVMDIHGRVSRVVLAFDSAGSSSAALDVAITESADRGVPLHIITAMDDPAAGSGLTANHAKAAETALLEAQRTARCTLPDADVTVSMEAGAAAAVVLRASRPGDLLVTGSHGYGFASRMLLGSTSSALVAHAPCPVLVARTVPEDSSSPVLAGVDGSELSLAAVRFAAGIAERRRTTLRAITAVQPVVEPYAGVSGPDEPALQAAGVALAESLAGLRNDHPGLVVEPLVVQAHPVEALRSHAGRAQMVVVGSHGHGRVRSALLGSVSRALVQGATCPVIVVRSSGATSANQPPRPRWSQQTGQRYESQPVSGLLWSSLP